jgi:hypothetical protein
VSIGASLLSRPAATALQVHQDLRAIAQPGELESGLGMRFVGGDADHQPQQFELIRYREVVEQLSQLEARAVAPLSAASRCRPADIPRGMLIPLSQVDQYLGLADRIRNGAGLDSFGRS